MWYGVPGTRRRVVELARIRFRDPDEIGDAVRADGRMDDQQQIRVVDRGDGNEVAQELVGLVGNQRLVDGVRVRHHQSVYPSGALFATASVPMIEPAPGRSSTTTGCPNDSWRREPMKRA
jgi:hypothetical protein